MNTRTMPAAQWKVLSQVKDFLSKLSNDSTFQDTVNKEFARILQKIQPSVYGNEIIHSMKQPVTVESKQKEVKIVDVAKDVQKQEGTISIPNVLNGLGISFTTKEAPKEIVPKWKAENLVISQVCSLIKVIINDFY